MATPVTDLRLRNAGVSEEQADAIAGGFEALSNQITDPSIQIRNVIVGQRIQLGLLLLVAAAILARTSRPGPTWSGSGLHGAF
jgi:hypothetical protein